MLSQEHGGIFTILFKVFDDIKSATYTHKSTTKRLTISNGGSTSNMLAFTTKMEVICLKWLPEYENFIISLATRNHWLEIFWKIQTNFRYYFITMALCAIRLCAIKIQFLIATPEG